MKISNPTGLQNSGTDPQHRQALTHLQIESLANGKPTCQACGEAIVESDPVTLYLYRPAGHSGYTIDQCRCSDHADDLTTLFTLGVREFVIDGRIGHCRPHDTNQTRAVLLAPSVRLISAPDTTSGRVVGDTSRSNSNDSRQPQNTGHNPDTLAASGDAQLTLSQADRDGSAATSEPRTVGRISDE